MTIPSNLIPTRISDLPVAPVPTGTGTVVVVIGGVTYQAVFNDLITSVEVPASRTITAGTGLTGGGDLSQNRTIAVAAGGIGDTQLDTTGVAAGTYGSATEIPQFVVNAQGRITGVTLVSPSFAGLVPDSRQIIAGTGMTGGGNLSANRTLSIDFSNATPEPLGSASAGVGTNAARDDHVHPPVDLEDASQVTGRLGIANGGTGQNITNLTAGAVLYSDGTNLVLQTPSGTNGQVLTSTGGGAPTWTTVTGVGTVTSVGLSLPNIFDVTGSPVTSAGTLTGGFVVQTANTVFAGPSTGSDDVPTFRTLVNADLQHSTTTVGSTTLTLGSTVTALAGLDTVTVTGNPTNALELAPKQYVDSVAQGLDVKASCKYASTTNVASISGVLTIDGQSTATGDRILLKNQSSAAENGIYVADDAGAWARSADMDNWAEVPGAFVFIESGDTLADTGWVCTADQGGTIDVTAMPWSQFSGVGTYIAGTGLTLTGNTFSITNTTVTAASYGAADDTLTATVNAQGQLTALAATPIAITNAQVSGLGTMSTQDANNVAITGGAIDGAAIGGVTPAAGTFTTATATTVNATTFDTNVAAAGATLSGTTLAADGTDTNINLAITPKGSGGVGINGSPTGDIAGSTLTAKFCVKQDESGPVAGFVKANNSAAAPGSTIYGCRSRGTLLSPTAVQDNDRLVSVLALGFDGTDLASAAEIDFEVDGTPGADDMPGRIVFKTSADGSQAPTEAMRISSAQIVTLTNALPIASGGTNATTTPTAGAIAYGTGTAYAFSAAGNSGEFLISGGTGSPTWTDTISGGTYS